MPFDFAVCDSLLHSAVKYIDMYLQWFDMIDKYEIQNKYKDLWFVMRDKYEIQDSVFTLVFQ